MEILSTGERIKKKRLDLNLTMRDLCYDKITLSKLSLIENNKAQPLEEEAKYLSDVLKIDKELLEKTIKEQIEEKLEKADNLTTEDLEYLLDCADKYEVFEVKFIIIKLLVYRCIRKDSNKSNNYINRFWDSIRLMNFKNNYVEFYSMLSEYFYLTKDVRASKVLFDTLKEMPEILKKIVPKQRLITFKAMILTCLLLNSSKEDKLRLLDLINGNSEGISGQDKKELDFYKDFIDARKPIEKARNEAYKKELRENSLELLNLYLITSNYYHNMELKELAFEELNKLMEVLKTFPNNVYLEVGKGVFNALVDQGEFAIIKKYLAEYIKRALSIEDITYIQYAYWIKAKVDFQDGNYNESETALNLSLNFLEKYKDREELGKRYRKLGIIHFKTGEYVQSIRAFVEAKKYR